MLEYGEEQDFKYIVNIKVIGVGGGGNNAVRHMMNSDMRGIDFWVANTDSQSLGAFNKENRIYLGQNLTKGLGAGANPEIGKKAAIESEDAIKTVGMVVEGVNTLPAAVKLAKKYDDDKAYVFVNGVLNAAAEALGKK